MAPELILASSSPHRRALLERLGLPFRALAPAIEEVADPSEDPAATALRLAEEKARVIAERHPCALVIGSDQIAELGGRRLGKPGTRERAAAQLAAMSGQRVRFLTGLCVLRLEPRFHATALDHTEVRMRRLEAAEIERYLDREAVLDCAGSFRSEGLGICLFEEVRSLDPTALIGLPLIALCRLLREAGIPLP